MSQVAYRTVETGENFLFNIHTLYHVINVFIPVYFFPNSAITCAAPVSKLDELSATGRTKKLERLKLSKIRLARKNRCLNGKWLVMQDLALVSTGLLLTGVASVFLLY